MIITMYTGPNCSLCDDAQALVEQLNDASIVLQKINIREHPDFYHLYATRIPVLTIKENSKELAWPFTLSTLQAFIQ